MTVTWNDIAAICEARGGKRAWRDGSKRVWNIPSPTGGTFRAEVTLRPRWCSIAIDRIRTTDRSEESRGWLEERVWPHVEAACKQRRGGYGILPTGGGAFSQAFPLDRAAVPELLAAWIDAELTWGIAADDQWPEFAPHKVIPGPQGDYGR